MTKATPFMPTMPPPPLSLAALYRAYIDCLNQQDWAELGRYVDDDVQHNGRTLGLSGYRDMLVDDFRTIPDLRFKIAMLVCAPPERRSPVDLRLYAQR